MAMHLEIFFLYVINMIFPWHFFIQDYSQELHFFYSWDGNIVYFNINIMHISTLPSK